MTTNGPRGRVIVQSLFSSEFAVLCLSIALVACVKQMQPIADSGQGPIRVQVAVGDTVRVLTKHGDRPQFKVTQIRPDALAGDGVQIAYDDMVFVERLTVSTAKSAGVGAMVVLLVVGGTVLADEGVYTEWPSAP